MCNSDIATWKWKNAKNKMTNRKNLRNLSESFFHSSVGDEWPLLCGTFLATADLASGLV